jgi:hypothetical protein
LADLLDLQLSGVDDRASIEARSKTEGKQEEFNYNLDGFFVIWFGGESDDDLGIFKDTVSVDLADGL